MQERKFKIKLPFHAGEPGHLDFRQCLLQMTFSERLVADFFSFFVGNLDFTVGNGKFQ